MGRFVFRSGHYPRIWESRKDRTRVCRSLLLGTVGRRCTMYDSFPPISRSFRGAGQQTFTQFRDCTREVFDCAVPPVLGPCPICGLLTISSVFSAPISASAPTRRYCPTNCVRTQVVSISILSSSSP